MATNPLAPNPETNIDNPGMLPDEPETDLSNGVPLRDPEDEEYPNRVPDSDEEEEEELEKETDEELPLANRALRLGGPMPILRDGGGWAGNSLATHLRGITGSEGMFSRCLDLNFRPDS